MTWSFPMLELFVMLNAALFALLFMLVFEFIAESFFKKLVFLIGYEIERYFKAKVSYVTELSKVDGEIVSKFN